MMEQIERGGVSKQNDVVYSALHCQSISDFLVETRGKNSFHNIALVAKPAEAWSEVACGGAWSDILLMEQNERGGVFKQNDVKCILLMK